MTQHSPAEQARLDIQKIKDLPPFPAIGNQLLSAIGEDELSIGDMATIIEQDPALTARIIGLANGAYFGNRQSIHSVEQAIIKNLGLSTVRSLALSIILSGPLDTRRCGSFELNRYWDTAILTATLASLLARHVDVDTEIEAEQAYLCGLLHNIGMLVLAYAYPDEFSQALDAVAEEPELSLIDTETLMVGVNHHQAGSWLARKWQLPESCIQVIENYHQPFNRQDNWPLAALIGFCSAWAKDWLNGFDEPARAGDLAQLLGLTDRRIARAYEQCAKRYEQIIQTSVQLSSAA